MEWFIADPVRKYELIVLIEAELIGTSDYVTFNVWMVMFLGAQGYDIKKNIIFRDN